MSSEITPTISPTDSRTSLAIRSIGSASPAPHLQVGHNINRWSDTLRTVGKNHITRNISGYEELNWAPFPTPRQAIDRHWRSGSVSSPLNPGYNHPPSPSTTQCPPAVPPSQHYPSKYTSTSAVAANASSTQTKDRSVCPECGCSFSRSLDLRRHFETQHLESRRVHRCPYCRNEYIRADSLKRHLDNGCEAKDNN